MHSLSASTIKVCPRNSPNLNQCILESIDFLKPRLATVQIADDFKVPGLEPLELNTIKMNRGSEFSATFTKLLVNGPGGFIIDKLKFVL